MQTARLVILNFVIFMLLVIVHHIEASESLHKDGHWTISSEGTIVRYVVGGETIKGHNFGFVKTAGNCSKDLLWISWSSYVEGTEKYQGIDATLQLQVDDIKFKIDVPVAAIVDMYPEDPSPKLIAFTNFVAGEKMIALMKKGSKADVTIIGPKDFVNQFEVLNDSFLIHDFIDARSEARKICEGLE